MEYLLKNERYMETPLCRAVQNSTIPTTRRINHGELPRYHIHGCHEPIVPKEVLNRPSVYSPNVLCIQTEEKEEAFPLKWSVLTAVTNSAG